MIHSQAVIPTAKLTRWRVPLGWGVGLAALYVAAPRPLPYAVGVGLAALGQGIRLWAASHLEKNRRLAVSGPYAWTRNPLYFGSLWLGLGFALATGRWALVAIVIAMFVLVYRPVMRRESQHLAEAFPEAHSVYRGKVPLFWPMLPRHFAHPASGSWSQIVRNREHWTVLGSILVALLLGWKLG